MKNKNLNKIKKNIILCSSYSDNFPIDSYKLKVAIKTDYWGKNQCIETDTYEDAIYDSGFVSIDGGKYYYLASNFIFHKLKRIKI